MGRYAPPWASLLLAGNVSVVLEGQKRQHAVLPRQAIRPIRGLYGNGFSR